MMRSIPRPPLRLLSLFAPVILVALPGCDDVRLLQPGDADDIRITLRVSGGIAGVDYGISVDGARREVVGVSCTRWCPVEPGGVILPVSAEQVASMANNLEDAGILQLDGEDFGVDCCDGFGYELRYRSGERTARVSGAVDRLPAELASLVRQMHRLADGVLPALVSPDTRETDWPRDAYTLGQTSVDGLELTAELQYGGGCGPHRIDLVVWGAWIETPSAPPHINALLTHDDGGDSCEALITDERTFGLAPLREAYERAFGPIGEERPTVVLRLSDPMSTSPLGRLVEVRL